MALYEKVDHIYPLQLSVVIPTYNRPESLRECLRGLAKQTLPCSSFQVLVVNDGGAEIPPAILKEWDRALDLKVLRQENRGASSARNLGACHAAYNWLAFLDDDCVPAHDWLLHFVDTFAREPDAVLGGETRNGLRENVHSDASQCLMLFLYKYYHQRAGKHSQMAYFTSNNLALPRHVFAAVGGFDETMRFAEDRDLCARLASAGYRLLAVPEARVLHFRPLTFKSFWRQHQAYGGGAHHYYQNRQRAGARDFRLEPVGFYVEMLQYPGYYAPHDTLRVTTLIGISQLANAYGFWRALMRTRLRTAPESARTLL